MSQINNEVQAAIAMALYEAMGYNMHDEESGKLTIKSYQTAWKYPKLMVLTK